MMVINHAEVTNNCVAGWKFDITEANVHRWQQMKEKLRNANSSRKSFSIPKTGRFHDLEQRAIQYVHEKCNQGFPITWEVIHTKALELSCENAYARKYWQVQSQYWLMHLYDGRTSFAASTLVQRLPSEYSQKLLEFQQHVIKLRKQHSYMLDHIGNADQTLVYFDMLSNETINEKGTKTVLIRGMGMKGENYT
jgi:hypothetical protein